MPTPQSLALSEQSSPHLYTMYRNYWRYKAAYPYCDIPIHFKMPGSRMKVDSPSLPKIGCHGNVLWGIGKTGLDRQRSRKYFQFREKKIVKIGPVDTIARIKKITQAKYIAQSASLPSRLNYHFFQFCFSATLLTTCHNLYSPSKSSGSCVEEVSVESWRAR